MPPGRDTLNDVDPRIQDIVRIRAIKPPDYHDRYPEFLSATDEKAVLAKALLPVISQGSVVDIGAGSGEIPDLMGIDPSRYLAVEYQPTFVAALRHKGYKVIEGLFPCAVGGPHDNVVLSYCLAGDLRQCRIMLESAWTAVASGGRLLAVTFGDELDDYNALMHRVGHTTRDGSGERIPNLIRILTPLGPPTWTRVTSHVFSDSFDCLAAVLSFMATNSNVGTVERRAELRNAIASERQYLDRFYLGRDGVYRFPIEHHLLMVQKRRYY
jgi:SAM-dependent methyltransferase